LIERNNLLVDIDSERNKKVQELEIFLDQEKTFHANENRKHEIELNFNIYNKHVMFDLIKYLRLESNDAV